MEPPSYFMYRGDGGRLPVLSMVQARSCLCWPRTLLALVDLVERNNTPVRMQWMVSGTRSCVYVLFSWC